MTGAEVGFLLLTSHLGEPMRRPLTRSRLKKLAACATSSQCTDLCKELTEDDLMDMGCAADLAYQTVELLADTALLEAYLQKGLDAGCHVLTRVSSGYPALLRQRLGEDAPGCLWCKGDMGLLEKPAIALVGSRELHSKNREFAQTVGAFAARKGYVLISGNARGADTAAQESCLDAGGSVISVVAERLDKLRWRKNVLYISEDGFDVPFSTARALSRNYIIHALPQVTFVAQCSRGRGGTWQGTQANIQGRWSKVFCFDDGSMGANALQSMGATLVPLEKLNENA